VSPLCAHCESGLPWWTDVAASIEYALAHDPMPPLTDRQVARLRELFGPAIRGEL